jgi:argininosuccinate lyase
VSRRWSEDYVAHVLRPNFQQAKRYLFKPLILVNKAHALMLHRTGLMALEPTQRLLGALEEIQRAGSRAYTYSEAYEDLYFAVEAKLIGLAGADAGGNLQIARSRNDIDAAMIRIVLRETLLGFMEALSELRGVLIERALEHLDALMPGYTHNQPAQPTTLAHYLGGVIGVLERDARRLRFAYNTVNRNPLGAAAMTTSGFPIRRDLTSTYLGFEGLAENAIDAVGGVDHTLEAVSTALTCGTTLSRVVFDLLNWASREVGFLRVPDEFVQISSIMPQKRNPVVLEHCRAKLARAHGSGETVYTMSRNVPFGDINDVGEQLIEPALTCFTELDEAVSLLSAVLEGATFNLEVMHHKASEHFTTATGLADALVANLHLPFRQAHHVTSRLVDMAYAEGIAPMDVNAELLERAALEVTGALLGVDDAFVQSALDPRAFVDARTIPGGPAKTAMMPFLARAREAMLEDNTWHRAENSRLRRAADALEGEIDAVLAAEIMTNPS